MAFSYYGTVTIDHTKVGSTEDVVITVSGTYADLATVANGGEVLNANGYDIGFYSDAFLTVKLAWETERYVATTGEVVYHVRVPYASSTVDSVVYVGYANASITTDQSDPTAVWDSDYLAVYHLPNGSSLTALDSTSNARNGTLNNAPTAAAGQIDGCGSFVSASAQSITLGSGIDPVAITMSCWIKATSFPHGTNHVLYRDSMAGTSFSAIEVSSAGQFKTAARAGVTDVRINGSTLSTATWYYVGFSYSNAAGMVAYLNGASDGTQGSSGTLTTNTGTTKIAAAPFSGGTEWNGQIDEVRISQVVRSAGRFLTEYNNQNSPSTFYATVWQIPFVPSVTGSPMNAYMQQ